MSAYSENKTQFSDPDILCEALADMGFSADMVERHQIATNLFGHHGDKRDDTAEIILRRKYVNAVLSGGASNDIGFKRDANGKYSAIISQFDVYYANEKWMNKLKQTYAVKGIQKQASKNGLRLSGQKTVNGKVQLQFVKV